MAKKIGRPRLYANARDRQRACRARRKAEAAHQLDAAPAAVAVVDHSDPVGVLAEWSRTTLIVPPGHPRSGEPMALPAFAVEWLRASWGAHESALSTARKNAKSAIAAVLALGYLVGPLRRPGWRGAVASLDKNKAGELRRQCAEIAEASGLDVKVRRSPYPAVISHVYAAADGCAIDDEAAWREANPGLGTIKSIEYMKNEVARVAGVASDEPSFRALDLNLALSPTREMVCTPSDLEACFVDVAEYRGPCYVAFDIGEASSGTAAVAYWPQTGALRTWLAFGDVPDLAARGRRDGADYLEMARRGELKTYAGRTVPVDQFVLQVEDDLAGAEVRSAVADGYKAGELMDVSPWPLALVRSGIGPSGSAAVRAFQRAVLTRTIATVKNYSLTNAIAESTLR